MKAIAVFFALAGPLLSTVLQAQDRLEEVFIISSKTSMPLRQIGSAVSVIDREEIRLRGYQSVSDLLRTQAGITASNSGGPGKATSVRIRGEESFRTLILIDGIEVSDPTTPQVTTQIQHVVTSTDIERVEILRGPQGLVYGADAGGVISIQTREGAPGISGQLAAEGGRYNSSDLNGYISAGNESSDVFVSLSDLHTDGFNARVADVSGERDGYENTTTHAKLRWRADDDFGVQLVLRDVTAETQFDNCGFPSTNDCNDEYDQTIGRLSLDYLTRNTGHNIAFSHNDIDRASFASNSTSFVSDGRIQKLEYVGNVQSEDDSLTLVFGGDLKNEEVDVVSGEDLERDQLGSFVEMRARFENWIFVNVGTRYDDNDDFGEHLSLRMSTAIIIPLGEKSSFKLRASTGNGFRAPSLSEIAYNNSDFAFGDAAATRLREETSAGADIGVEYHHLNGHFLGFSVFNQRITDEILFDLVNFSGYLQEDGESESQGIELMFELPFGEHVSLLGNYTYNDTETNDDEQRIRRPEHAGNIALSASFLRDKFTCLTNIRMARDAVDEVFGIGRVDLDDYYVVDLSANYNLLRGLDVFARVENLADDHYQEIDGFNTAGTSFYGGVRYQF